MGKIKDAIIKKVVKKRQGYSDEEMEQFLENPRNEQILSMVQELAKKELVLAGADPNEMKFNRTNCVDVGLDCIGWGRVVVELRAEDV